MSIISSQHVNHSHINVVESATLSVTNDASVGGDLAVTSNVFVGENVAVNGSVEVAGQLFCDALFTGGILANVNVNAQGQLLAASASAPSATAVQAIRMGNAFLGPSIYFGTGAPTVTANKGSLYIQTDGIFATQRLYINTDGAATWAHFTASA